MSYSLSFAPESEQPRKEGQMTAEQAMVRSVTHNEIVTIDYSDEAAATLEAAADDSVRNGPVTEYWGTDEDGDEWRVHLRHGTRPETAIALDDTLENLVVVERMPDCHRESHRAAGNWGRYPANGAERVLMTRDDAETVCADDSDEYDHIVRDATDADRTRYDIEHLL